MSIETQPKTQMARGSRDVDDVDDVDNAFGAGSSVGVLSEGALMMAHHGMSGSHARGAT
jgi:hypothetical protein